MKGSAFDEAFVKGAIMELLQALDFLHAEVQAVHTGRMVAFPFLPTYINRQQDHPNKTWAPG